MSENTLKRRDKIVNLEHLELTLFEGSIKNVQNKLKDIEEKYYVKSSGKYVVNENEYNDIKFTIAQYFDECPPEIILKGVTLETDEEYRARIKRALRASFKKDWSSDISNEQFEIVENSLLDFISK